MRKFKTRIKTSIYVDEDLWKEFKKLVSSRDQELSEALESLIREELMVDLETVVKELVNELDTDLDFKPVKAKAIVSELVREIRDERESRLLRQ
uniref:CopG family transcriptional regulator n=1 Tax=Staphylothermus marinus TaxID=2280 RepID=A0A7C4H9M4_STAMA